jgi:hypothetical protein
MDVDHHTIDSGGRFMAAKIIHIDGFFWRKNVKKRG